MVNRNYKNGVAGGSQAGVESWHYRYLSASKFWHSSHKFATLKSAAVFFVLVLIHKNIDIQIGTCILHLLRAD